MALKFGKYLLLAALMPLIALPTKAQWAQQATSLPPLVSSLVVGVRQPAAAPSSAQQIFFTPQAVFESSRGDGADIYAMNLDGSIQRRLTNYEDDDMQPSLSLDGSKVVFVREINEYNYVICSMNSDGTTQRQLTEGYIDLRPSISPDKSKIVFERNSDIYIMNVNGSNLRRLTLDNDNDEWPSFSPDGTKIIFNSNRHGRKEIYTMNIDGTNIARVTNTTGGKFLC